ncbi:ABC transporter ATP-binding protein [Allobranchiibius sp. CTAmp26]|uniref:ABC transporter ATP-binding protein n=1 Tax=Allobranchiibius sp. CTAmp26 TaxID=2815214 RepID=UPI001AA0B4C1|nr:ABC transporter ATP-binding protein [Allobranchiibius sp. CTAmp26]
MTRTQKGTDRTRLAGGAAIRLDGVHKSFGDLHAVRGIDLQVEQGEIVAFLGPNGAGKTTTIDMILGLGRPDEGTVQTLGMAPRDAVSRGLVAAVMQTGGLLRDVSVAETVELTASLFVHTRDVQECLERAGIWGIRDQRVGKCSGGEQQRLRFAMALVSDPALLVLDEPTTGMDVTGRRDFWAAIRSDARRGRTVLFATHYLEEADQYADRIVLVRHGEVVADGTGAQIKARASGRTIRATLDRPDRAALLAIEGVEALDIRGESVTIGAHNSDAVARALLNTMGARDLEITAQGLEEAFMTLTSDANEGARA